MNRLSMLLIFTVSVLTCAQVARSAPADGGPATQVAKATQPDALTVATLDFDADLPGNPDMGKQISEILTATLSGQDGFTLVDRSQMDHILTENAINLSGLVNPQQAVKIGKLVGARILLTGKIFLVDKQVYLTAKLIGTETSLVDGVLVKGDKDADVGQLMMQLADKVTSRLREVGPKLVAQDDALSDPLLERITSPVAEVGAEYWVIVHHDLRRAACVRAVIDWIRRLFDEHRDELAGAAAEPAKALAAE